MRLRAERATSRSFSESAEHDTVNARWLLATRQLAHRDDDGIASLLDLAEAEFVELGRDADVVCLLAEGVASGRAAAVTACRVLAAIFGITVDRFEVPMLPSLKSRREAR